MKFLPDVNVPPSLGENLTKLGHTYRWVPVCLEPRASDLTILQEAALYEEVILTNYTDFGTLLAFSGSTKPSVVLFRIDKVNSTLFYTLLIENWSRINQPLVDGALVLFEEDKLRIRNLPISRR